MAIEPKAAVDSVLATGLVTSPAWAPWIENLNSVLTTLTLLVGLALGIGRLVAFLRERNDAGDKTG